MQAGIYKKEIILSLMFITLFSIITTNLLVGDFNVRFAAIAGDDSFLAYSSLAYKITKNDVVSSILGIFASSLEAEINGNIAISYSNVIKKVQEIEKKFKFI